MILAVDTLEGDLMSKLTVTPHGTTSYASNLGPWLPAKLMALNDLKTQSKQSSWISEIHLHPWHAQNTKPAQVFSESRSRGPIFLGWRLLTNDSDDLWSGYVWVFNLDTYII